MADDDKTNAPNTPGVDNSDVFAREKAVNDPPKSADPKSKKDKKAARSPVTVEVNEKTGAAKIVDDPGMSPEDAAAEIVGVIDAVYQGLVAVRGYDRIQLPDGQKAIDALSDPQAKQRLERAFVRLMKTSNMSLSPGAAVAIGMIGCYGLPIASMEMALFAAKKQAPTS